MNSKVVLVTGAARGIGLEIVRKFLSEGDFVVMNDIDSNQLDHVGSELADFKDKIKIVEGDSSNLNVINELIKQAELDFGIIDTVIANAGITHFCEFLNTAKSDFDRVMDVNLAGTFFLAQQTVKRMITNKVEGRLVFMSSVTGHQAHPNLAAYSMTKAALEMLAKSLVPELSPFGITINAVAPGATITERTQTTDPDYAKNWASVTPNGRAASVRDIAEGVYFLTSDQARHISGQTLIVDGGWTSISPVPYK